jgi:hypothetical protein
MEILFLEEKDSALLEQYSLLIPIHATIFVHYKPPHIPDDPIIPCSIAVNY